MDLEVQVERESARALELAVIETGQQYADAAERLQALAALRKAAEDHHGPVIAAAHAAHKAALAAQKKIVGPIEAAEAIVRGAMSAYATAQRQLEEERVRLALEAEATRKKAEAAEAARVARSLGASTEEIRAIRQEIREAPSTIVARPSVVSARGVAAIEKWEFEVIDLGALIGHVAKTPAHRNALVANLTFIRKLVDAQREHFSMPGVRVTRTAGIRRTGR